MPNASQRHQHIKGHAVFSRTVAGPPRRLDVRARYGFIGIKCLFRAESFLIIHSKEIVYSQVSRSRIGGRRRHINKNRHFQNNERSAKQNACHLNFI